MARMVKDAADRRRAAESINESLAVEAGAGTGKTTLLISRIVNLLLRAQVADAPGGADRPVRIHEIAAITFTEKAAGELKARLRDELERAVATGSLAERTLDAADRERLARAIEDLDRATLSTIHAFCAALIRERPIEAQIEPGRVTADAVTQRLLLDEAWGCWRELAFQNENDTALINALRLDVRAERTANGGEGSTIRDLAESLVANRDLLNDLPRPVDGQSTWHQVESLMGSRIAMLKQCLGSAKKQDKAGRVAQELIDHWDRVLGGKTNDERCRMLLEVKIDRKPGGDAKKWADPKQLERLRLTLAEINEQILPDCQALLTHNLAVELARRLTEFVTIYEQLKADRGLLDFQDLLLAARALLQNSAEARQYFRDRFRFLLIDEFQDTDPLQAEVALMLAAAPSPESVGHPPDSRGRHRSGDGTESVPATRRRTKRSTEDSLGHSVDRESQFAIASGAVEPGRLFLVGDPKQSIYRFRRADIEIYQQCLGQLGRDRQLSITCNFRSGANVIQWINRVFPTLIERSRDGEYQPEYVELDAGPNADLLPGQVVLLYPPVPAKDQAGKMDAIRYREGCCIARFIQRAIAEGWPISRDGGRPLRLGDVAILLPQTTGIDEYEDAFRACELPYHMHGGKHFYQRLEIKSLIAVLAAVDNPEDGIAVVAALRSPFFGCSDEDFLKHALAGGKFNYVHPVATPPESLGSCFDLLARLHRQRNSQSVTQLLLDLFESTKGLESFLTKPHGEARVANLMKVVDAAGTMERTGVLTFRGFARWLSDRQSAREEESESPAAEPGDESVEVLTVHKAKGLEFPMTVVANLNPDASHDRHRFVFKRVEREVHFRCGPIRTAGWRSAVAWDVEREEAEKRRLFYVAATRARDYLVLPLFWRTPKGKTHGFQAYLDGIPDLLPPVESPPWGHERQEMLVFDTPSLGEWPARQFAPRIDFVKLAHEPAGEQFLCDRADWIDKLRRDMERGRAGRSVVRAKELVPELVDRPERPTAGPSGSAFGSLVHQVLELYFGRLASDPATAARRLAALAGLTESDAERANSLARAAVESPFGQRLLAAERLFLEVPFTHIENDRIIEGRMDVLAEEPAGLLLVDFKSDKVEPGGESIRADHYAPQLRAYARAISAATGRPVRECTVFFLRTLTPVSIA